MSRWTFSNISFSDPAEENEVYYLSVVAITEGSVDVDAGFEFKCYFYHPTATVTTDNIPGYDTELASIGGVLTEVYTETIQLNYGIGTSTLPDWHGNTNIYDATYKNDPIAYKAISYTVYYRIVTLSAPTEGTKKHIIMLNNDTNVNEVSFEVVAVPVPECDAEHLELCIDQPTCEGAGLYWYDGECHLEPECRSDNLPGCYDEADCEAAGGYWTGTECSSDFPQILTLKRKEALTVLSGALVWIYSDFEMTTLLESGTADVNGQYTTGLQTPGTSYYIKFTHADIIDSDGDNYENDSYVAEVPTV